MEVPEPGPGEVSIDVAYAGANFAEVLYRQGVVAVPLPFVPGTEVSGRIRALGEGVDRLSVGQPVAALTIVASGGYAEVVTTSADLVAQLGETGLEVAAAVPSNSTTAFLGLERVARLQPGERVLVHAAAGGAGSQLGQVARLVGAGRVVGTVGSEAKIAAAIWPSRLLTQRVIEHRPRSEARPEAERLRATAHTNWRARRIRQVKWRKSPVRSPAR